MLCYVSETLVPSPISWRNDSNPKGWRSKAQEAGGPTKRPVVTLAQTRLGQGPGLEVAMATGQGHHWRQKTGWLVSWEPKPWDESMRTQIWPTKTDQNVFSIKEKWETRAVVHDHNQSGKFDLFQDILSLAWCEPNENIGSKTMACTTNRTLTSIDWWFIKNTSHVYGCFMFPGCVHLSPSSVPTWKNHQQKNGQTKWRKEVPRIFGWIRSDRSADDVTVIKTNAKKNREKNIKVLWVSTSSKGDASWNWRTISNQFEASQNNCSKNLQTHSDKRTSSTIYWHSPNKNTCFSDTKTTTAPKNSAKAAVFSGAVPPWRRMPHAPRPKHGRTRCLARSGVKIHGFLPQKNWVLWILRKS